MEVKLRGQGQCQDSFSQSSSQRMSKVAVCCRLLFLFFIQLFAISLLGGIMTIIFVGQTLVYWISLAAALVRLARVGPATACILLVSSDCGESGLESSRF